MATKKERRGGARPGAGRKAPQGRGRPVTVYLTPPQLAALAALGSTPQQGIRAMIEALTHTGAAPAAPNGG